MDDKEEPAAKSAVNFIYKTMLERAPGKRRVKPVEKHLMSLDFVGLGDSSDDSDYEVPDEKKNFPSDESEDLSSLASGDSDGSDGVNSDDDSSADDNDKDDEESVHTSDDDTEGGDEADGKLEPSGKQEAVDVKDEARDYEKDKNLRIKICAVCLGDKSEATNEVVLCDSCGVTVHEGCYGISDTLSLDSTDSTNSTEPWFCDSCKAGVLEPICELCPVREGIYKETDRGRWVHLVCALYTPGVAFGEVDKLSMVTMYEMPYTKWGAKECMLCAESEYSYTGVCIVCDAGMCKASFHVTCAQRYGLLSEAASDVDIADPFFAYCKQHVNKAACKQRKHNYTALQAVSNQRRDLALAEPRMRRKLEAHKQEYLQAKAKRPPCWVFTEKTPRFLQSSYSALTRLTRKAELMGIDTKSKLVVPTSAEISKRWNVPPSLTPDFALYYTDRNSRIDDMKSNLKKLKKQQGTLQNQARTLRAKYDKVSAGVDQMKRLCDDLRDQGQQLYETLNVCTKKQTIKLPAILVSPKKLPRSPTRRRTISIDSKQHSSTAATTTAVIHKCGTCQKSTNQHQLAKCDKCGLHHHLGCLNPPLTRMPKKTRQCGWQCSQCDEESDNREFSDVEVDTEAPRKLRRSIKGPVKYVSSPSGVAGGAGATGKSAVRKKPTQNQGSKTGTENTATASSVKNMSSPVKAIAKIVIPKIKTSPGVTKTVTSQESAGGKSGKVNTRTTTTKVAMAGTPGVRNVVVTKNKIGDVTEVKQYVVTDVKPADTGAAEKARGVVKVGGAIKTVESAKLASAIRASKAVKQPDVKKPQPIVMVLSDSDETVIDRGAGKTSNKCTGSVMPAKRKRTPTPKQLQLNQDGAAKRNKLDVKCGSSAPATSKSVKHASSKTAATRPKRDKRSRGYGGMVWIDDDVTDDDDEDDSDDDDDYSLGDDSDFESDFSRDDSDDAPVIINLEEKQHKTTREQSTKKPSPSKKMVSILAPLAAKVPEKQSASLSAAGESSRTADSNKTGDDKSTGYSTVDYYGDDTISDDIVLEGCDETPMLYDGTNQMIEEYEHAVMHEGGSVAGDMSADREQGNTQSQPEAAEDEDSDSSEDVQWEIAEPIELDSD